MKWSHLIVTVLILSGLPGCTPQPSVSPSSTPEMPTPTFLISNTPSLVPTLLPDKTPPSAIAGLTANNAYDNSVNLSWDKSTDEDFDHYNLYLNTTEMADITGLKVIQQIKDVSFYRYQATGLELGTKYYFAVTAVDRSGNEYPNVTSVNATPILMTKGTKDPDLVVDVYQRDRVWAGTTLLADNHIRERPRIIEVNMLGEIIWEYLLPQNLRQYTNPGFDTELLTNGHILFVLPGNGVYEIDRSGKTVWSYMTLKISHDADRLPNGNTIFAFGFNDQKSDAQVVEVNPKGEVVWTWQAKNYFNKPPYDNIFDEGWTHTNAVSRLANGNTLISLRNFNVVVEVDAKGELVRTIGEGILDNQHDPEVLPNGNLLTSKQ
jgi:hypothetical protein